MTNYNEDEEEDDLLESGEENYDLSGYAYQEPEVDVGGIDVILDHRPREELGMSALLQLVTSANAARLVQANC